MINVPLMKRCCHWRTCTYRFEVRYSAIPTIATVTPPTSRVFQSQNFGLLSDRNNPLPLYFIKGFLWPKEGFN